MQLNFKRMVLALAAVVLFGGGSIFASPPPPSPDTSAYLSGRASTLLAEVQDEAAGLTLHAETLWTFSGDPKYSWRSHAFHLDKVKGHINAVSERTAELQRISYAALPWQQKAITELTAHAMQVAASTQAAIVHLNGNQDRLMIPEYREHLTTIADHSADMKQSVDKFLDYEKAQQKFQQLQTDLELSGD